MISIIIPTILFDNKKMLERCTDSIKENTEEDYEIVVIENNYHGFTKPVNEGLRKTFPNDVIIMSDDTVLKEKGWLKKLKNKAYENEIIGAVTGNNMMNKEMKDGFKFRWAGFNPIFIKRTTLNIVGLLDENYYYYYNESDWCLRAHKLGFLILQKKVGVEHNPYEQTIKRTDRKYFRQRSLRYFEQKWGEFK